MSERVLEIPKILGAVYILTLERGVLSLRRTNGDSLQQPVAEGYTVIVVGERALHIEYAKERTLPPAVFPITDDVGRQYASVKLDLGPAIVQVLIYLTEPEKE